MHWLIRKKSSLQWISGFFCLHVNLEESGFKTLQASIRSKLSEALLITSNDFLWVQLQLVGNRTSCPKIQGCYAHADLKLLARFLSELYSAQSYYHYLLLLLLLLLLVVVLLLMGEGGGAYLKNVFARVASIYANLWKQKKLLRKSSTLLGFVWNVNMATVTSCENAL